MISLNKWYRLTDNLDVSEYINDVKRKYSYVFLIKVYSAEEDDFVLYVRSESYWPKNNTSPVSSTAVGRVVGFMVLNKEEIFSELMEK